MSYESFVNWLQGFMEIGNPQTLNKKQVQIIKDHLALVFKKVTPDREKEKEVPQIDIMENDWSDIYEKWKKKKDKPWTIPYPKPSWGDNLTIPATDGITYCAEDTAICSANIESRVLRPPASESRLCSNFNHYGS